MTQYGIQNRYTGDQSKAKLVKAISHLNGVYVALASRLASVDTPAMERLPSILAVALPVPFLVYLGNPAIALLVAAAISLAGDIKLPQQVNSIGKYALQTAIVLLGLKLQTAQLVSLSADYSLLVTGYVITTLGMGLLLGKLLMTDAKPSQLVSSGTAICGGTTIASLSPVIGATPQQTAVALTMVFILNAIALFTYPYIGQYLELTQEQFGIWCALSIHDTSSVVATAMSFGDEAGMVATTLKLGRTLWLIPLLIVASILQSRTAANVKLPVFVLVFIIAVVISTIAPIGNELRNIADIASKALLVVALYCIGLEISRNTIKELRGKTVIQGVLLWGLVSPATLLVILQLT